MSDAGRGVGDRGSTEVPTMQPHAPRELLPCAPPFLGVGAKSSVLRGVVCRSVERRLRRREHWIRWANDGVASLKSVAGGSGEIPPLPSVAQMDCLDSLGAAYCRMGAPPDESAAEAFIELCGSAPGYAADAPGRVSFVKDRVALPPPGERQW